MTEYVDISAETRAICAKLGHKHDCVAQLDIYPTKVVATVFHENEHGSKYHVGCVVAKSVVTTPVRT